MRALPFVALALLLAGCASNPTPTEPASSALPSGPTVMHFAGNYSVEDDEGGALLHYQGAGFEQPGNCIVLQGHPRILKGTATATWSSPPGTPAMELLVENGSRYLDSQDGAGLAEVHLHTGVLDKDSAILFQVARRNLGGVAVIVRADVRISFDYVLPTDSEDGLEAKPGYSCWLDH